jgi:hypothetical protein
MCNILVHRTVESISEGMPGTLATSGGSISIAAAHFCPICGIIATSEANLEDHLTGRRHARRLAYIKSMPEKERHATLARAASGEAPYLMLSSKHLSCLSYQIDS